MENNCIITVHWVIWQSQRRITVMAVFDLLFMAQESQNEQDYLIGLLHKLYNYFSYLVCSRTRFSKTKDRQSNPNFNSYNSTFPSQLQFLNSLTTSSLFAAL